MWNIERRYRRPYVQTRKTDPDIENKCMDTKGERSGVGGTGKLGLIHIHY